MKRNEFDELAKALAGGLTRREALRRVGGGFAGLLLTSLGIGTAWGNGERDENEKEHEKEEEKELEELCEEFCERLFGEDNPLEERCEEAAEHRAGACFQCGPGAPAGHPDACIVHGVGTCCPSTAPKCCGGRCGQRLGGPCHSNTECCSGHCRTVHGTMVCTAT